MIDYVDEACKAWGRCTRWIVTSSNKFGDPEGYPTATTIAKARDGMLSFGATHDHSWPEVRLNDALTVARAMAMEPHMPLLLTVHIWAQYVIKGRVKQKLPNLSGYLGMVLTVAEYWRNLDRAHFYLAGRLALKWPQTVDTGKTLPKSMKEKEILLDGVGSLDVQEFLIPLGSGNSSRA